MGRASRIAAYVVGILLILVGLPFISEYVLVLRDQSAGTVPNITIYPVTGPILIGVGILIIYLGHKQKNKEKV